MSITQVGLYCLSSAEIATKPKPEKINPVIKDWLYVVNWGKSCQTLSAYFNKRKYTNYYSAT